MGSSGFGIALTSNGVSTPYADAGPQVRSSMELWAAAVTTAGH